MITRFAPSPTGLLHLGHAYSALFAYRKAMESGGKFLLRIEDIDPVRCKPEYVFDIFDDLKWLGIEWKTPVRKQSEHLADYQNALLRLDEMGVLYPCFCTRREVAAEISEAGHAPHAMGVIYSGVCRNMPENERKKLMETRNFALRLDVAKANLIAGTLFWHDSERGNVQAKPEIFGDIVLARKDIRTSYHLSVTVDDALQGVNLVTRGEDLFNSTHVHRLLQALLGYEIPAYNHHKLLVDATGKRYAKRNKTISLKGLRARGMTAAEVVLRVEM